MTYVSSDPSSPSKFISPLAKPKTKQLKKMKNFILSINCIDHWSNPTILVCEDMRPLFYQDWTLI